MIYKAKTSLFFTSQPHPILLHPLQKEIQTTVFFTSTLRGISFPPSPSPPTSELVMPSPPMVTLIGDSNLETTGRFGRGSSSSLRSWARCGEGGSRETKRTRASDEGK